MRVDSAPTYPQPVSRATWCALAAVVPLLGALALLLMGCQLVFSLDRPSNPNYYTCQIACTSGFGIGAEVEFTAGGIVRASPGGAELGQEAPGSTGTITEGPGSPAGSNEVWWRVLFADNLQGWVPEARLQVIGGTGVVVQQKDLDVCVPVEWNENRPEFDPSVVQDVAKDCTERVLPVFKAVHSDTLPPGTGCIGQATEAPTLQDSSCDSDCLDSSGVCVRMGWDPDPPAPDPISTTVFGTTSVCEVAGTAALTVGTSQPKRQPGVRGIVQILGRPCPGAFCQGGVAYRFNVDDIEFDSGTIFASDPKFVDLNAAGSSEPQAVQFGPFLGCTDCSFGGVPAGTAFTDVQGRRSGSSAKRIVSFRNADPLGVAIAVNWVDKTCRLSGDLGGQAIDDNGDTLDVGASVELEGVLVNQPPHVNVSATAETVECTSPQGARVTLDGSASTDPDINTAFYVWRRGSETGPHVAAPSTNPVATTQQALGQTTYDLRVVDTRFAADHGPVTVAVVDTTQPTISCNAPLTITPSDVMERHTGPAGVSFKATAADVCSGISQVVVTSVACSQPGSCKAELQGDTITILNPGGVGDTISWTVSANDGTGNPAQKTCRMDVVKRN